MNDRTDHEQPDLAPGDRPMTGYDDFGHIIFLPRSRAEADVADGLWRLAATTCGSSARTPAGNEAPRLH